MGIREWWFGFKVFVLGGPAWPGQPPMRATYPNVDVLLLCATHDRLVLALERARSRWPREYLLQDEWAGRQPNVFADLTLVGLSQPARLRYLDDVYGTDWRDSVHFAGNHLLDEATEELIFRLPTTACVARRTRLFDLTRLWDGHFISHSSVNRTMQQMYMHVRMRRTKVRLATSRKAT